LNEIPYYSINRGHFLLSSVGGSWRGHIVAGGEISEHTFAVPYLISSLFSQMNTLDERKKLRKIRSGEKIELPPTV
jgi:hypothetical protein